MQTVLLSEHTCKLISLYILWIRDRPIWLFWARYRCQYISHSWTDNQYFQNFESCFLLDYQKYDVFYALPFFKNLKNQELLVKNFFFGQKLPATRARELFKPSTDSASLLVEIENNVFRFGFFWRWRHNEGMFSNFWPPLPSPGP